MSKQERKKSPCEGLLHRYRTLPRDLHSRKFSVRNRAQRLFALTICVPVILCGALYIAHQIGIRQTIERDNREYRALYITESPSEMPAAEETAAPSPAETEKPAVTAVPTAEPTAVPSPSPSPTQAPTTEPSSQPSASPAAVETAAASAEPFATAGDEPLAPAATPNENTVVLASETAPPVLDTFADLLAVNPETVGYLTVGSQISLPVVQRANDNEYYLTHNFSSEESDGGTLFMDGSNLLVPEDRVLFIYGHNMRNGTMFQPLTSFERIDYFRSNAVVHFDTIYEEKRYTPVAVFRESVDPDSEGFFNIREFAFDDTLWELYRMKIEKLSMYEGLPELKADDKLLMLITCEYTHDNGRLIVVLRELRDGETEADARAALANAQLK